MYKDGQIAGNKIEPIQDVLKRGMWKYQVNDVAFTEQEVVLDNGLTFNLGEVQKLIDEKKEFLSRRTKSMQWFKEPAAIVKVVKKAAPKGKAPPKGTPLKKK